MEARSICAQSRPLSAETVRSAMGSYWQNLLLRKRSVSKPANHFDFHAHNDYDLAVSNVLAAVLSGAKGLHTTINGLGERAGNAPLDVYKRQVEVSATRKCV